MSFITSGEIIMDVESVDLETLESTTLHDFHMGVLVALNSPRNPVKQMYLQATTLYEDGTVSHTHRRYIGEGKFAADTLTCKPTGEDSDKLFCTLGTMSDLAWNEEDCDDRYASLSVGDINATIELNVKEFFDEGS